MATLVDAGLPLLRGLRVLERQERNATLKGIINDLALSVEGGSTFSDAELERIQYIWERVAEDYLPFEVDVTTADPGVNALRNSGGGDTAWGIRVVIGGSSTDWYSTGSAGVWDSFPTKCSR